jgi:predicted dehydrogenase
MVLKWGILGSGRIAKDFACSMMAVDGSECVAVASRKPSESLTAFAASFGCRPHTSYEAMAADAEVEAVYVATILRLTTHSQR